jgi:hypothetical protein
MIKEFADRFMSAKAELMAEYRQELPKDYGDIVKDVIRCVADDDDDVTLRFATCTVSSFGGSRWR